MSNILTVTYGYTYIIPPRGIRVNIIVCFNTTIVCFNTTIVCLLNIFATPFYHTYIKNASISFWVTCFWLFPFINFISISTISKYTSKSKFFVSWIDIPKCARLDIMFAVIFWSTSFLCWVCSGLFLKGT